MKKLAKRVDVQNSCAYDAPIEKEKFMFAITLERLILAVAIGVASFMFATSATDSITGSLDPISAVLTGK
jgi:hypothetical protein